ncbi:hypothetical protein [uncultured Algibacter sp.]|uniref:hypothetical protein n=1 Tax=uncultured Algibacter sp. TaxID=298659 RepID=UPI003216CC0B
MNTKIFEKLSFNRQFSFSMCNYKDNESDELKYIDCFHISEFKASTSEDVKKHQTPLYITNQHEIGVGL